MQVLYNTYIETNIHTRYGSECPRNMNNKVRTVLCIFYEMNVRFVNWYKTNIILCCCFFFGLVRLGYLRFAFCLNSKVACLAANSGGLLLYHEAVVHMYLHALQAKTYTYRIYGHICTLL